MKIMKKLSVLLLALLLIVPGIKVSSAATKPVTLYKDIRWKGDEYLYCCNFNADAEVESNAVVESITSSKKSVIKVVNKGTGLYEHYLVPKKTGKTKITIKYSYLGTQYKVSATYTVKKYPNPFKYLKVDGKKIKTTKYKYSRTIKNYKKATAKIQLKLKSGWKIYDAVWSNNEELVGVTGKKTFTVNVHEEDCTEIFFILKNKKKHVMIYRIFIDGPTNS